MLKTLQMQLSTKDLLYQNFDIVQFPVIVRKVPRVTMCRKARNQAQAS